MLDAPANELEAVSKRRDRVTNLVRELGYETPGGDETVALHEVRLQRREPRIAIAERRVRVAQLGEPRGERISHLAERRAHLIHFLDTGRGNRRGEIAGAQRGGRSRELLHRARNLGGEDAA